MTKTGFPFNIAECGVTSEHTPHMYSGFSGGEIFCKGRGRASEQSPIFPSRPIHHSYPETTEWVDGVTDDDFLKAWGSHYHSIKNEAEWPGSVCLRCGINLKAEIPCPGYQLNNQVRILLAQSVLLIVPGMWVWRWKKTFLVNEERANRLAIVRSLIYSEDIINFVNGSAGVAPRYGHNPKESINLVACFMRMQDFVYGK